MKKFYRNTAIVIAPFLFMVTVNEVSRAVKPESSYRLYGVRTINPEVQLPEKCTWNCHNNTSYCKKHHVLFPQKYFPYTDPFYNGIIRLLRSTGDYVLANLIFLVFLFPLLILLMLIKTIDIQAEINNLRKRR